MKAVIFLVLYLCAMGVLADDPALSLSMSTDDVQEIRPFQHNYTASFMSYYTPDKNGSNHLHSGRNQTHRRVDPTLGDISKDLQTAYQYTDTFQKAFDNVASIAAFFGPEGEAVAAVFKLASGLFGLAHLICGEAVPSPEQQLANSIKTMWKQLNSRFDELSVEIRDVRTQVLRSEITELFAVPEENMVVFISASQNLFAGSMTKQDFVHKLKPYVETTGDFTTGFGLIRDCISGKLQSCQTGGVPFVEQVGAALNYRPTQVANFFGYYHALLTNAANAYCSYQVALLNETVQTATCDTSYANSLHDFASKISDYYSNTLRGARFMYASDSDKVPPMMEEIIKKHGNYGIAGGEAIIAELKQELDTYYTPVNWFQYYFISVWYGGDAQWQVSKYSNQHDRLNGSGGWKKNVYGYNVVYAWVPKNHYYTPALPTNWKDCEKRGAVDRYNCLVSTSKTHWYTVALHLHGTSWYGYQFGGQITGGWCTTEPCAKTDRRVYWLSPDKKDWMVLG
jgi:hypothetical protein